jgi:uncharacterized membrane protein YraQ (UPF0718 family)
VYTSKQSLGSDVRQLAVLRQIDVRIPLIGLLIAAICAVFWIDSRYPSLQGKAGSDPREALATPLGFERHFPEPPADQTVKHIGWTAAEWAITNKQGMTFGVLLAAGLLTLVPLLPRPRGGRFSGSVQGAMIGAPLGVCVNCAAPIGQAMLRGGSRVEVALAAMFSSPSFNVIVVSMLITLFPWHLVLLKLATSAIMVLAIVPVLAHLSAQPGWHKAASAAPPRLPGLRAFQWLESPFDSASAALLVPVTERSRGLGRALAWALLNYLRNLWTVIRLSLPLMALAGLIGAAMVEFLPWTAITHMAQTEGLLQKAATLAVVAGFGLLLPVPIAFDIVLCSLLWNSGVPIDVVATLLVTLGIYSIYPWTLIGVTLSWRIAALAGAAVFALGTAAGAAANVLENWHQIRLAQQAASMLASLPVPTRHAAMMRAGWTAAELRGLARPLPAKQRVFAAPGLELWSAPFAPAAASHSPTRFIRVDGPAAGFERLPLPRPFRTMQEGIMEMGGIASADVNGDGWPDVAIGTQFGAFLYLNLGGQFVQQQIDFPDMRDWPVSDVAMVDLDGDGAPDLFFCAWMHGCHILFNRDQSFSGAAHTELPRSHEVVVMAAAFADVDRNGSIDIVTGAAVWEMASFHPDPAVNHLWRNDGHGHFTPEALAAPEGETLSLLFTDLNGDGWPDLIVGNDFDEPDRIFMNDHGQLKPVKARDSPIPYSTTTTMSIEAGDLDNDGRNELYFGQIAMGNPGADLARRLAPPVASCNIDADLSNRTRCDALARFGEAVTLGRDTESLGPCTDLADPTERRDCVVTAYHWNRVLVRLPGKHADKAAVLSECARVPADFDSMHDVCEAIRLSSLDYGKAADAFPDELSSTIRFNMLYTFGTSGYSVVTGRWRAGFGGWSWNSKFADLDNDTWQDLFVAQGTRLQPTNASAVFYHNKEGKTFEDETRPFGLEDHRPTGSYLLIDYDLDGRLDLITYPFLLTPVVWKNEGATAPGFDLSLDDRRSRNRFGIGARIEIRAADGRLQVRDIKASGGYQSYDQPVAHFGLGDWGSVASLKVNWPDGEVQQVPGTKLSPGRYTLVRLAKE